MSFDKQCKPNYLLKKGNQINLETISHDGDFNLLGFLKGVGVMEAPSKLNNHNVSNDDVEENLCGKQVVLKTNNARVLIVNKKTEFPLKTWKVVTENFNLSNVTDAISPEHVEIKDSDCDTNLSTNVDKDVCNKKLILNTIANKLILNGITNKKLLKHLTKPKFEEFVCQKPIKTYNRKRSAETTNKIGETEKFEKIIPEEELQDLVVNEDKLQKITYNRKRSAETSNKIGETEKFEKIIPEEDLEDLVVNEDKLQKITYNRKRSAETMNKIDETEKFEKIIPEEDIQNLVVNDDKLQKIKANKVIQKRRSLKKRLFIRREIEKYLRTSTNRKKRRSCLSKASKPQNERLNNSTQTENSSSEVQLFNEMSNSSTQTECFDDHLDTTENEIILKDVHMGYKPVMSFSENMVTIPYMPDSLLGDEINNEKKILHQYLTDCVNVHEMGNLKLHLEVMANNLLEVRRQCMMLTLRQVSIDWLNDNQLTPLHLAVIHGCCDIVMELLKYHADISATDLEGNNSVHLSVIHNEEIILSILVNEAKQKHLNLDSFNYHGFTPLMLCAIERKTHLAERLLDDGDAEPNLRDQKSGRTPLFHAVVNDDLDMAKLLLKYNADTKIRNFFGTSTHEAMFEIDNINVELKMLIIGKDVIQNKKKPERKKPSPKVVENKDDTKKFKFKMRKLLKKINDN